MAAIKREDIDNLNIKITIDLSVSDYKKEYQKGLDDYNQKASFKGFRAGKAPLSYLKKVYGKSILAELINTQIQKNLDAYLKENNIQYLGQPIPSEGEQAIDFNPFKLEDFSFNYDLGLAPDFEVKGVGDSDSFNKYKVVVSDEEIEKELTNGQKRLGESKEVEDAIVEGDLVKFKAKEKGTDFEAEFSVAFDRFTKKALAKVKGKKVGHTFSHNIFDLEQDTPADQVKKHMLGLNEDSDQFDTLNEKFDFEIISVNRVTPCERNEEFFKKYFGEESGIIDEAGAKESIKERITSFFDEQATIILNKSIEDRLLEENKLELPEGFLKRWLLLTSEQDLTEEILENEFEGFKKNLMWSLISGKLGSQYDVKVGPEDIRAAFKKDIFQYMGGNGGNFPDEMLNQYIDSMMQNQEQVETKYREQMTVKVFQSVAENITIVEDEIDNKAFEEVIKKLNEAHKAETEAATA